MENENIAWIEQPFGLQGGHGKSLISSLEKSTQQHFQRQQQEGPGWLCYILKARPTCFVSERECGHAHDCAPTCVRVLMRKAFGTLGFFTPITTYQLVLREVNLWSSGLNAVFWLHAWDWWQPCPWKTAEPYTGFQIIMVCCNQQAGRNELQVLQRWEQQIPAHGSSVTSCLHHGVSSKPTEREHWSRGPLSVNIPPLSVHNTQALRLS